MRNPARENFAEEKKKKKNAVHRSKERKQITFQKKKENVKRCSRLHVRSLSYSQGAWWNINNNITVHLVEIGIARNVHV